jgi:hypothetical protein
MSSQQQPLFPNSSPFSLDNYDNKKIGTIEGLDIQDDATLDTTMGSLMTEYAKDTTGAKNAKDGMGTLTGTSMNMNLLQGDLVNYSRYDTNKNPIQPFTTQLEQMDKQSGVVSYKEGLANDDSSSSSSVSASKKGTTSAAKSQKLLDLEKKLSELTTEYTTQYRLHTDDLVTRSRFLQTNSQYLNKIVRDLSNTVTGSGAASGESVAYYYVNPFGYTHRYKDISPVLLYDDKTCPKIERDETITSSDNPFKIKTSSMVDISSGTTGGGFARFSDLASYDMGNYGPCITTKNVKLPGVSSSEDVFAWVDTEGKKHVYEKGVWPDKRHSSCLTSVVGEPIVLTKNQYDAIPTATDTPMKESSECFRASVSPTINTKLAEIKKKIDDTVAEIKKENQNILNNAANTIIVQRDKTLAEKWASVDDDVLGFVKKLLGDYYYPAVYAFWCFIILVALLLIFKFTFMFVTPGGGSGGNGNGNGGDAGEGGAADASSNGVSLLGIAILALIVIFAVYYYFSYTYNLDVSVTKDDPDIEYTTS